MAIDKRYTSHTQNPNADYATSVTIHLPTSSANDTLNSTNIFNRQHHCDLSQLQNHHSHPTRHRDEQHLQVDLNNNNNSNDNSSNTIEEDAPVNGSNLDFCHHQAATRSLLPDTSTTVAEISTTESDDAPTPPPNYHDIPGIVPAYQGRTSGPPPSYDEVVNPNAPPPSYHSLFGQAREARKTSNGLVDLFRQLFLILIGTLGCTMIIGFLLLIPITMILVGIVYVNQCRAENIPSLLVIGGLVWIVKNILNCYNQFKKDSSISNRPPPRRAPISTSNRTNTSASNNSNSNRTIINGVSAHTAIQTNLNTGGAEITYQQTRTGNPSSSTPLSSTNNHPVPSVPSTHQENPNGPSSTTTTTNSTTRMRTNVNARGNQPVNRIRNPSLIGITSFKCESMLNYFLIVWFLAGCIVVYRSYEPDYDNPLSASYCNRTVYLYAFWLMTSACVTMAVVLSCLCCLMVSSLVSCNHGR